MSRGGPSRRADARLASDLAVHRPFRPEFQSEGLNERNRLLKTQIPQYGGRLSGYRLSALKILNTGTEDKSVLDRHSERRKMLSARFELAIFRVSGERIDQLSHESESFE